MDLETVGIYLERQVVLLGTENLPQLKVTDIPDGSTLMIYFSKIAEEDIFKTMIPLIVQKEPLVVFVCGENCECHFDQLIQFLDSNKTRKHIMTKLSGNSLFHCAEEFLQATWPSEDRWEEWNSYTLILIGGDKDQTKRSLESILSNM